MHHVAVTFDDHHVGKFDRTVFRNSADIVASQVDQHHMLGAFFRVGEEFLREGTVLSFGRAATASSSQRADCGFAVFHTHHDFR